MSLRDKVGSSLRWSFAFRFSSQFLIWLITILVLRQLSPSDYGLMAMAAAFIGLLIMFRSMGLHAALVQRRELDDETLRKAFGLLLLFNVVLFAVSNLLAPYGALLFEQPRLAMMIYVLSIGIPFGAMETVGEVTLKRRLDFKRYSLVVASTRVLTSLITLFLAYNGFGVWSLVLGNVSGVVARGLSLYAVAGGPYLPHFSLKGTSQFLNFGARIMAGQIVWFLNLHATTLIIGKFLGSEALGHFEVGKFLANIPLTKTTEILSSVAFSSYSRAEGGAREFAYYFVRSLELSAFFLFPALMGISAVSYDLIVVVLGVKWLPALPLIVILPFHGCFYLIGLLLSPALDAVGRPERNFYNICTASVIVIPSLALGAQWGITGVALAWLASYPVVLVINYRRNLRFVGCSGGQILGAVSGPVFASGVMYGAVALFQWTLPEDLMPVLRLGSSVAVGALTYGLFALTLNRDTAWTALDMLRPKRA